MKKGKIQGMASKWRYWRKPTKVGYNRKGYSFNKSIKAYKKNGGWFKTVSGGSGHTAGYKWAMAKGIDPHSTERRYSKNSPSFDEGVYRYKDEQRKRAKMKDMAGKLKQYKPSVKSSMQIHASNPPKSTE